MLWFLYSSVLPICVRFYSEDANKNNQGYRAAGFTIELRDTGQYGFLLPPDQVILLHKSQVQSITEMCCLANMVIFSRLVSL